MFASKADDDLQRYIILFCEHLTLDKIVKLFKDD
jgi:hypothetical protein